MRTSSTILFFALAAAAPLPASASGEGCTAAQKTRAEKAVQQLEDAERTGKARDAHAGAQSVPDIHCATNGYKRRDAVMERTSKKLGAEAEKTGNFNEAFDYYRAPRNNRADYDLADADRALLKHIKANSENYKAVFNAMRWFENRDKPASLKELRALAKTNGEKTMAAEEKAFAGTRLSLGELQKAREWLALAGDAKPVTARAESRGDTLLTTGTFSSVERAFQYYEFAENQQKLASAKARARKLGDEHSSKGQTRVAMQFYDLAGDSAKSDALQKKIDAQEEKNEKGEGKRQDQFKKDQQSLEKALGL